MGNAMHDISVGYLDDNIRLGPSPESGTLLGSLNQSRNLASSHGQSVMAGTVICTTSNGPHKGNIEYGYGVNGYRVSRTSPPGGQRRNAGTTLPSPSLLPFAEQYQYQWDHRR
ncbi:hypothetical protein QIS74_09677 [Colletotrichum tabaci]|uniref:Uncharacterized protein n=1 Tax=Colletotrichum tabaci TaxID=1209068 RepID=A0AAV9T511_9PEZI